MNKQMSKHIIQPNKQIDWIIQPNKQYTNE